MRRNRIVILLGTYLLGSLFSPARAHAQGSGIAVFYEDGFPTADSAAPSRADLAGLVVGARFAAAAQLHTVLSDASTRLVLLPYGSGYPELAWPDIYAFLQRGGNLLVLGGKPFTRAAYRDAAGWHLRA